MTHMFNSSMYLPYTLFEPVTRFNDDSAGDMQCGDMGEEELLALGLNDISEKVDPYRLIHYPFPHPGGIDGYFGSSTSGIKISHSECVDILFTEMKELAGMFSFYGEYRLLIEELIGHFRYGNGSLFYSQQLNSAFHKRINIKTHNSPLLIIKKCIEDEFKNHKREVYIPALLHKIQTKLLRSKLAKFNNLEDRINGLGICVHDIAAQKITLTNFQKYAIGLSATLHFVAQDHFGLDVADIKNKLYREFRFSRIWCFLLRHRDFAFKPFFTNFNTITRIGSY
ncbi:TPA: YPO3983 family protein [Salmonella enterica subsp. arizonae serovar -:z4,z24:-]